MSDIFPSEKRSEIMRKVKSKGNRSTEIRLIYIFDEYKIRGWRRNYNVIGHPDFVFLEKKIAIFVDGCFWHGHHCRNTIPTSNSEYWEAKRNRNIQHDRDISDRFLLRGWSVLRIWECELTKKNREQLLVKFEDYGLISAGMCSNKT